MNNEIFGIIYKITNNIDGKIYIGQARDAEKRFKRHIKTAKDIINGKELDYKSRLYRAMAKHGVENFTQEIIDIAYSRDELNQKEIYWIDKLDARNPTIGYNICKGGDCGPGGPMFANHKHSDATKLRMSLDRTGEKNANYGNRWHHTSNMKYKYDGENNPMYGKKHSEQEKEKNRLKHQGKKAYSNIELDQVKMLTPAEALEYLNSGWFEGNIHAKNYKPKNN